MYDDTIYIHSFTLLWFQVLLFQKFREAILPLILKNFSMSYLIESDLGKDVNFLGILRVSNTAKHPKYPHICVLEGAEPVMNHCDRSSAGMVPEVDVHGAENLCDFVISLHPLLQAEEQEYEKRRK